MKNFVMFIVLLMIFSNVSYVDASVAPSPAEFDAYLNFVNVDLVRGDPQINIPLMTVPGRGGLDYPITLSYSSDIKLNQQAGVVGLGWNINIPAVYRSVNGVPDDKICYNADIKYHLDIPWYERLFGSYGIFFICFGNCGPKILIDNRIMFSRVMKGVAGVFPGFTVSFGGLNLTEDRDNHRKIVGYFGIPEYINPSNLENPEACEAGYNSSKNYDKRTADIFYISSPFKSGRIFRGKTDYYLGKNSFYFFNEGKKDYPEVSASSLGNDLINNFFYVAPDGRRITYDYKTDIVQKITRTGTKHIGDDPEHGGLDCNSEEGYFQVSLNDPFTNIWYATSIVSYDYVDLNNNGADDQDKGNWIKFGYSKVYDVNDPYIERDPYGWDGCSVGGNGESYKSMAKMEVTNLDYIETPTHIAYFNYDFSRQDTRDENGKVLPRLVSIELYSKEDLENIISRVEFVYDYSLVPNTPGSNSGKLTLKEIRTYGFNGEEVPSYKFEYNGPNPSYDRFKFDRWGNYYSLGTEYNHNRYGEKEGLVAGAWALTDIFWPSGGSTHIDYDLDRYVRVSQAYSERKPGGGPSNDKHTHYGGGNRVDKLTHCDGLGECFTTKYLYVNEPYAKVVAGNLSELDFVGGVGESSGSISYDLPSYSPKMRNYVVEGSPYMPNDVLYDTVAVIPGYNGDNLAQDGFSIYEFITPGNFPHAGYPGSESHYFADDWMEKCKIPGKEFGFCPNGTIASSDPDNLVLFVGVPGHEYSIYDLGGSRRDHFIVPSTGYIHHRPNHVGVPLAYGDYFIKDEGSGESARIRIYRNGGPSCFSWDGNRGDYNHNLVCDAIEFDSYFLNKGTWTRENDYGKLKNSYVYDSEGNLVSSDVNCYWSSTLYGENIIYRDRPINLSCGTYSSFRSNLYYYDSNLDIYLHYHPLASIDKTLDGVTYKTEFFEYSPVNGLPKKVVEYGSQEGVKRVKYTSFAYEYENLEDYFLSKGLLNAPYISTAGGFYSIFDNNLSNVFNLDQLGLVKYDFYGEDMYPSRSEVWLDADKDKAISNNELIPQIENLAYDDYGNVLHKKDAKGIEVKYYYGNSGECSNVGDNLKHARLTCTEDNNGKQTKYYYDEYGRLNKTVDPNGLETYYEYDNLHRLIRVTNNVDQSETLYEYNYGLSNCDSLDPSNEDCMNWVQTKNIIDVDKGIYSVTRSYVDGLGRHLQTKSKKDDNTAISVVTYYNERGLVDRISEPIEVTISWLQKLFGLLNGEGGEDLLLSYDRSINKDGSDATDSIKYFYYADPLGRVWKQFHLGVYNDGDEYRECGDVDCTEFVYSSIDGQTIKVAEDKVPLFAGDLPSTRVDCDANDLDCLPEIGGNSNPIGDDIKCTKYVFEGTCVNPELEFPWDKYQIVCEGDSNLGCAGDEICYASLKNGRISTDLILGDCYAINDGVCGYDKGELNDERSYDCQRYVPPSSLVETDYTYKSVIDANGNWLISKIDKLGNVVAVKNALGYVAETIYDVLGRVIDAYDFKGRKAKHFEYNTLGQVVRKEDINSGEVNYTYDLNGNLNSSIDSLGRERYFEYDNLDRLIKTYVNGELISENFYDSYGGGTSCRESFGSYGFLCEVKDYLYNTSIKYLYDAKGRTKKVFEYINGDEYVTEYSYNEADDVTKIIMPSGDVVEYSYNALNQLESVSVNGVEQDFVFDYNPEGSINSITYPNGLTQTYSYTPKNLVEDIAVYSTTGTLFNESYWYDHVGGLTKIADWTRGGAWSKFGYDSLYRLTNITSGNYYLNGFNIGYEYDAVGNRVSRLVSGNTADLPVWSETYNYGDDDRLDSTSDCSYEYDAVGNMISKTCRDGTTRYYYDVNDMIYKIEMANGDRLFFKYDANGRRVYKSEVYSDVREIHNTLYVYGLGSSPLMDILDVEYIPKPKDYPEIQNPLGVWKEFNSFSKKK